MTKIEELEQKLNELKANFNAEFYDLQNELAELKESKKEGKWKPAIGEDFWHRDEGGLIACCHFPEYNQYNRWMVDNIPIFPTKEQCQRYWHFMDTVKEKSYEFSKEELVDTNIEKWYIGLKHGGLCVDFVYGVGLFGAIYFKTEENAQYIIDNFKDELMEYWI